MKLLISFSIIPVILLLISCSTSKPTDSEVPLGLENKGSTDTVMDDRNYYRSLADYLQKIPGITISGSQNNEVVTVRGESSFISGVEPLFVINGQIAGTNYVQVNNSLNVRDIDNVKVLKGADAGIYGVRGGNGVILIVTKK